MSREIDVRTFIENAPTPERAAVLQAAADRVSADLPGNQRVVIQHLDATTGNPRTIGVEGAAPTEGDFVQRALQHVQAISPAMGLAVGQAPEYIADPAVLETSSGAHAVNLQQRYKGIPIFQADVMVRFAVDGRIHDTTGSVITVNGDISTRRKLSAQEATLAAAKAVAQPNPEEAQYRDQFGEITPEPSVDITNFVPKVIAAFPNTPEQSAVLEQGPFGDEIKASLTWFPVGGELKLGWDILLTFPNYARQYDVVVDANTGAVLYAHQKVQFVAAAMNVYHVDGASTRQLTNVPLAIGDYGLPFPIVGQDNWRWCHKCQGLFFAGFPGSHCPAGGAHDSNPSSNYQLPFNNAKYPGQLDWRWCHKCQGLFFNGHATKGKCPAGGAHENVGSFNYGLLLNKPLGPGQHGWRWCHKCESLFFSENPGSVCPAGGAHDGSNSGDYALLSAGLNMPAGFPDTWVASNKTVGNSTSAHLDEDGAPMQGSIVNSVLTFNPSDPFGNDQKVLNIFYYCCYMHDLSYLLGFREKDGNFQTDDFGRGGLGADSVDAQSFSGTVTGTANMATPIDGLHPTMNMGLYKSTNRHTAFDSTVVFHEFTHGISNRLVGGPMNDKTLDSPQSRGMGEGWSDYMACTINDRTVVGSWLVNNPKGIRGFPYDSNFPDHFGMLGTGRYGPNVFGQVDPHNVGEIWCATLMELNRRVDKHLVMQAVIDALKITPANPSFLDARDALNLAILFLSDTGRYSINQVRGAWMALWSTFAHFGMGPNAKSNGAQLSGIVPDFQIGQRDWRYCHKCQGLFFNGHATKGKCPAGGAHDSAGSFDYMIQFWVAPGENKWRWCHKCEGMYFSGGTSQGVCPSGGAHENAGSGDYTLISDPVGGPGQNEWRRCKKCLGLQYGGFPDQGACPAGGKHDHAGSPNYSLLTFSKAGQPFADETGAAAA